MSSHQHLPETINWFVEAGVPTVLALVTAGAGALVAITMGRKPEEAWVPRIPAHEAPPDNINKPV